VFSGRQAISAQSFRPAARHFETWVPVILYTGLIFSLSSIPDLSAPGDLKVEDKVIHVVEYFFWGLLLRRGTDRTVGGSGLRNAFVAVLAGAALAYADESFQRTVGRQYSVYDMAADVTGVILAQVAYGAILMRLIDRSADAPAGRGVADTPADHGAADTPAGRGAAGTPPAPDAPRGASIEGTPRLHSGGAGRASGVAPDTPADRESSS
jgi:VanZ family protein